MTIHLHGRQHPGDPSWAQSCLSSPVAAHRSDIHLFVFNYRYNHIVYIESMNIISRFKYVVIYNTYNHILFKCKCVCEMEFFFVCISTNTHSHASNCINTHLWAICIYMYNYIYTIDYTYICTYTHIYTDTLTYTVHFHFHT